MDTHEIIQPLNSKRIWLKVVGVFFIAYGISWCLSIVGIIFGWLPIWLGLSLMQVSSNLETYETSNDPAAATIVFEKLALYFQVSGITIVVFVCLSVVGIVLSIVFAVFGLSAITMTMPE